MDNIRIFSYGSDIHIQNAENFSVEIYDMTGRLLYFEATNNESNKIININANGVYLVKVGNRLFKKVIIVN